MISELTTGIRQQSLGFFPGEEYFPQSWNALKINKNQIMQK